MADPVNQRVVLYKKANEEVNLTYNVPVVVKYAAEIEYIAADDDLEQALKLVKQLLPNPGFQDWKIIAFATAKTCGVMEAIRLMNIFWPEDRKNGYKQLFNGYNSDVSPTFKTLLRWARQIDSNFLRDKASNALKDRIEELRRKKVSEADLAELQSVELFDFEPEVENNLKWETKDTSFAYGYVEAECGAGKTEWMIDRINSKPGRYIIALPLVRLIKEVMGRLEKKHGDLKQSLGYKFKTIYSKRNSTLIDDEEIDENDGRSTVTFQLADYKNFLDKNKTENVVIFITHAALFQTNWTEWSDFELIVDEVPEIYINYTQDLTQNPHFIDNFVRTGGEEKNYYRLRLTDDGAKKFEKDGHFDDIDSCFEGLLEAINNPNTKVYAHKNSWDLKDCEKVRFLRLVYPGFLQHFTSVCIMGDKFTESLMCMVWEKSHNVRWYQQPDWKPFQKRIVPVNKRVKIHYFADIDQRRASATLFEDDALGILKQVKKWMKNNVSGQRLVTSNVKHRTLFDEEIVGFEDVFTSGGVERQYYRTKPDDMWIQPKVHGLNVYRDLRNVVWLAAMRPGKDEIVFLEGAFPGIKEEDIIRWREYNSMYQFIMRIALRKYECADICNVYVWDYNQVAYLENRFGGSLEVIKHNEIKGIETNKGGRPKNEEKGKEPAKTNAERVREHRAKMKLVK
jgi:hypothetical protein